jgi:uncharacterized membrane protein (DUF2068 family)
VPAGVKTPGRRAPTIERDRALGLRLIIAYKFVRGGLALALAITLLILAARGGGARLHHLAATLRDQATTAVALKLANLALKASQGRRLHLVALALAVDGSFTVFEGWALSRGLAFAPWLVVVATAAFVPWEIVRLARHLAAGRLAILILNLAIVAYLARRALRERATAHPSPEKRS